MACFMLNRKFGVFYPPILFPLCPILGRHKQTTIDNGTKRNCRLLNNDIKQIVDEQMRRKTGHHRRLAKFEMKW